jgi:large subunit ribosomal protein L6
MSRVGKKPIEVPGNVSVTMDGDLVSVKGPKGELSFRRHSTIDVKMEGSELVCSVRRKIKESPALWGTTRARIGNMVEGVVSGYKKQLELQGVGYRAQLKGKDLQLALGYSHPIVVKALDGITFTVENNVITVEGIDKEKVGQVAADIRKLRKPEPYKGKGVRYVGENVRRKVGKVMGSTE